ncbi:hypothetical protein CCMSSC00406_0001386 [Pleurotus cornucopiae]|uniref:Uncharacterized protein n=1 Tax=Pleurotus cornucopiae TaxID=5321 RepID=A0ACB7IPK8_PLECO|nr:hypothetical protein CCMSSC00406_0001386 [Pleurotus cornucopiae]
MFPALDIDIRPGSGLGIFEIGASLWNILHILHRHQEAFPQVDVKYDPDSSVLTPIILHLRPHLDLLFSSKNQRLHTICLRRLRDPNPPVVLRYKDTTLSSMDQVLRRSGVNKTFGPTYAGEDLKYPGLWFSFEEDGLGEGIKGNHAEDRGQVVKRVFVSQKPLDGSDRDALDEVIESPTMAGEVAKAIVKIHVGITLFFHPIGSTEPLHIRLGETTAQDLTVDLGPPSRKHYKDDDRMTIHSTSSANEEDRGYFYNYFQHGLDFLISGTSHIVRKVIVHTNIPGTPQFQRYKRCIWELEGQPEDDEDDSPPRRHFSDRFETISHFLNPRGPPPSMPLDRTADDEGVTLANPTTRLYGYDGIVLEVTDSSHVVSLTLF